MMTPDEILKLQKLYGSIQLTREEIEEALLEKKIQKYFREKHREYWDRLEKKIIEHEPAKPTDTEKI